ncbi:MAG: hypothetical protein IJG38_04205 [Thermoguttaceae bacterium]|nr:hypothetical protein [Thermoguttaceae bacterium]
MSNYASVHLERTLAAEASENLLNVESQPAPLVRGRLRPPKGNKTR